MRIASLAMVAVFVFHATPTDAGGNPFNASIAKTKKGKYKSSVIDIDQPAANPQKQTKKIEPGRTAKFFVKVKNSAPAPFNVGIFGDAGTSDFDVAYFLNGEDVTADYAGDCLSTEVPAEGKVLFRMEITATGATASDTDDFAMVVGDDSSCFDAFPYDTVWAIVKVI